MIDIDELGLDWLEERNMLGNDYNHMKLVGHLTEEISEGISRSYDEHESVDWRVDCMIFIIHSLLQDGYSPSACLKEGYAEINSRVGSYNEATKKWEKDKSSEAVAKHYKANYNKCRLII